MRRMNLTDEEVRHIEQRRVNEKQYAIGYNHGLRDALICYENAKGDASVFIQLINDQKKVIIK